MTENIKGMGDAELKATIAAYTAELERREAVPTDEQPDPEIKKMIEQRRDELFGNHLG